jgi:short-subunit dehydrogenase
MRNYTFAGGTAVVTGAASGIGEALSHALAARGSNLVLLDRDADRLAAVVAAVRGTHPTLKIATHVVDLADGDATQRLAAKLRQEHPHITLLVNNAGVALGGRLDQVTLDEFEWVMNINFRAVVQLTHALLPALKSHRGSHLVNVSSLFGLIAPAGQTAYASSKFAVRGFTEALRSELAADDVGVTCVHPGGIRTRIAETARVGSGVSQQEQQAGQQQWAQLLTVEPAKAADIIINGVERRRPRVLIGSSTKIPDVLARLLPGSYGSVVAAGTRILTRQRSRQATTRRRAPHPNPTASADRGAGTDDRRITNPGDRRVHRAGRLASALPRRW